MTDIYRKSALDTDMLGMVPMVIEQSGRGERSSLVIADDYPRVTASPGSVRLLEAPAPADMPLTGSASDLRRRHDVQVGAGGCSASTRTTTLEQQQRLTACARGASNG